MKCLKINIMIFIQIFIVISLLLNYVSCKIDNLPCQYNETVDLTNSQKFLNGSYSYDGILIPEHLVGIYNHRYVFSNRIDAEPHVRGCICKLRKCINWCCNKNEVLNSKIDKCIDVTFSNQSNIIQHDLEVKLSNGINTKNLSDHFYPLLNRRPCDNMFPLAPHIKDYDEFDILENGDVIYLEDNSSLSSHLHCIGLDKYKDINTYRLTAYVCSQSQEIVKAGSRDYFYMIGFMIAIPFLVVTLLVYAIIPELKTLHGKSLIGYLLGLIISYSGLVYIIMAQSSIPDMVCTGIGYTIYFFFMSSFFWLNIVSFDLWWNFTGRKMSSRSGQGKRFLLYCLYSYGVPLVFLAIVLSIDFTESIPKQYRLEIGVERCFVKNEDWSAMIYYYSPMLILSIANTVFFVLTAKNIHKLKHETKHIMSEKDSYRAYRNEKSIYELFLKLFILMGITWSLEVISYIVGEKHRYIFHISDFCNMMQGVLIFVFFIMKGKIWQLIKKRFGKQSSTIHSSFPSSKITHINVNQNVSLRNLSTSQTFA